MRVRLTNTKQLIGRFAARTGRQANKLVRRLSRNRFGYRLQRAYWDLILPLAHRFDNMWQAYLKWRWQKTVSRAVAIFAVITLSSMTYSAFAATSTATLVPNNNSASGWTAVPSGSNYTTVDDGAADDTSDYVQVLSSNSTASVTDTYGLTTASAVSSASQITLRIYIKAATASNGGTMDTISLNLLVNGVAQTAATCTPVNGTWAACSKTFTGSWTQTDVDSMQVQIVRNILGSGNPSSQPDTVQVSNVYGTLTYVPSIQFNQSAYRWFSNQDTSSPLTFAKSYGNTGSENADAIVQTSDGGYAVTGQTNSSGAGGYDMFLAKYGAGGDLQWNKIWGGSYTEEGKSLIQTSDGGYLVVGSFMSSSLNTDSFIMKFNSDGTISWQKSWSGAQADKANDVIETSDGYAVVGETASYGAGGFDMFLLKLDLSGNVSWSKTWGGAGNDYGKSIVQASDGGYVVTGQTYSYGDTTNGDIFIAKFDGTGNTVIWCNTLGGTGTEEGLDVIKTSDGGYALTGDSYSYFDTLAGDMVIAKYGSDGSFDWSDYWGDYGGGADVGRSLTEDSSGNYIVTGKTASLGAGGNDVAIVTYDLNGNLLSSKTWGGTASDQGTSIASTQDGGYVIAGQTLSYTTGSSDLLLLKYDSNGSIAGCSSPMCQTVSPHAGTIGSSPGQSTASLTATTATIAPGGTIGTANFSTTVILAPPSIDVSSAMAAQDTAAIAPDEGTIFRLRMDIHTSGAQADTGTMNLKLQYADKGVATSCSNVSSASFNDITDTSTGIRWADNAGASSGMSLVANSNDPKHGTDLNVNQSYQEKGTTVFTNPNAIPAGQDGMWDFGLVAYHSLQNKKYCFRVVTNTNGLLDTYTKYPEITIPPASFTQASYRWYNPEPSGSASTFIKAYGNGWVSTTQYQEQAKDVVSTSDGGYATVGYVDAMASCGQECYTDSVEALITKYDSSGTISWTKKWGGSGTEYGNSIAQTSDGGYVITGYTTSFGAGSADMFLAKYSSSGSLLWSKTWGGSADDRGNSLMIDGSGNILVVGSTSSYGVGGDIFLAKYSSSGGLISSKTTGVSGTDDGMSISPCSDGGYLVAGTTYNSNGTGLMEVIRFDSLGNVSWAKSITGSQLGGLIAAKAAELQDGSVAIVGHSLDGTGAIAVKYDSGGNFQWSHSWSMGNTDYFYDLVATDDNGFIAVGSSDVAGDFSQNTLAVKYTSDGTRSWSRTWGPGENVGYAADLTSDGGFAVAGYRNTSNMGYDSLLLKYDSSGSIAGCPVSDCQSPTPTAPDESTTVSTPGVTWTPQSVLDSKVGYSVGDTGPAGGIIFYVDSSNSYSSFDYLEAAPTDQGTSSWGCSGTVAGATWSGLGNGDQNTTTIVGACSGSTAAKMSDSLTSGGYSDWYLPDLEEVNMMISNISSSLSAGAYWSSSEDTYIDVPSRTGNYAYASSGDILKTTVANVRSTRKFTGIEPGLGSYSMTTTVIVGSGVSVGNPLAAENKPLDLPDLTPLTLRVAVRVDGSGIDTSGVTPNGQSFKLQYAVKSGEATCSAVGSSSYSDITTSSELAYYDDGRYADDQTIVDNPNDPSDGSRTMIAQSYQEANNFTSNVGAVYAGQDGMWQFSLVINNSTLKGRDFCIRITTSGGTMLTALNVADVAYAPQMEQLMRGGEWFSRSTGSKQHISL